MLVEAIKNDLKPRDIITRKSIENAIALVMATGGSTNAVLHYLAIASAAGVKWTIDDFERMRKQGAGAVRPQALGRFVAVDFHRAGGVPQVLKILLENGVLHGECMTIHGKTMAQMLKDVPAQPRTDQEVIRPWSKPMYARGPPRDPQGQPRAGRLRRQDHRPQEPGDHRAGARVRLRERVHEGDHGEARSSRAT